VVSSVLRKRLQSAYDRLAETDLLSEYHRYDGEADDLMIDLETLSGELAGVVRRLLDDVGVPVRYREIVRRSFVSRQTWYVRPLRGEAVDVSKYPQLLQNLHLLEEVRKMIVEALAAS